MFEWMFMVMFMIMFMVMLRPPRICMSMSSCPIFKDIMYFSFSIRLDQNLIWIYRRIKVLKLIFNILLLPFTWHRSYRLSYWFSYINNWSSLIVFAIDDLFLIFSALNFLFDVVTDFAPLLAFFYNIHRTIFLDVIVTTFPSLTSFMSAHLLFQVIATIEFR